MALSTAVLIAVTIKSAYLSKSLVDRSPEKSHAKRCQVKYLQNPRTAAWPDSSSSMLSMQTSADYGNSQIRFYFYPAYFDTGSFQPTKFSTLRVEISEK